MDDLSSFYQKKADELKKEKKFEDALNVTDKAKQIQADTKSPDYWYKRGIHFCEFGEYEKALDCFDKDIKLHGKSYDTFFVKGKLLFNLKKYAESIEYFNKAEEERTQHYLQSSKKIKHLKNAQQYEKALLYTDAAINEKPLDETFWYYKGMAFLKLQKFEQAISCFTKALEIQKNDPRFLYEIAKCELFTGNQKKCIDLLEKSYAIDHTIKEKLQVDNDFSTLSGNKQFRVILGL